MFDYAIKNGTIVDGSRQKSYVATLYLKDGRIAEIAADDSKPARRSVNAAGGWFRPALWIFTAIPTVPI